jgi:hypothetical protein
LLLLALLPVLGSLGLVASLRRERLAS